MEDGTSPQALVIDDDGVARTVHTKMLVKQGYEVSTAEDGSLGLERLCSRRFDLVLCDIQMPKMDGLEMITQLREWEKEHGVEVPQLVICVSAGDIKYGDDINKVAEAALEAGMMAFVKKPLKLSLLKDLLSKPMAVSAPHADLLLP